MKKYYSIIAISALLLTACGGSNGGSIFGGSTIDIEEVEAHKAVSITNEDNAPTCKIDLNVKYAKGDDERARTINNTIEQRLFMFDSLTMQQAVDSFATYYTTAYQKNMAPLYREDRADESKRAWYEYKYEIKTDTRRGKDGCLVYIIDLDMYEGGAHGIRQQLVMNFDEKTGKQITYKDLFVQGYSYILRELLLEELKKQTDTNTLDELHEKDYLLTMDIYPPQNFILGDDEITFIFNPYEIAPYEKGNTELTLSYSKLSKILK
ncbi:MAG: DUF3298 domain-containing protein [Prevotella sp.]|nr:DUF3298 domain-containing protein [Prevotella sp.]